MKADEITIPGNLGQRYRQTQGQRIAKVVRLVGEIALRWEDMELMVPITAQLLNGWEPVKPKPEPPKSRVEEWEVHEDLAGLLRVTRPDGRVWHYLDQTPREPGFRHYIYRSPDGKRRLWDNRPSAAYHKRIGILYPAHYANGRPDEYVVLRPVGVVMEVEG